MAFDKKEYWKRRNNTTTKEDDNGNKIVIKKPLRGQGNQAKANGITVSNIEIGFENDGKLVAKNRAYRRQKVKLPSPKPKKNRRKKK